MRTVPLGLALSAVAACASATARRADEANVAGVHPGGVLQIAWRTTLHEHGLFEPAPEECASGALAA